jgi:hypothetical protein
MRALRRILALTVAAAALTLGGATTPASAYPAGAIVLVAQPSSGSAIALPLTCVVQTGSETTGNTNSTSYYGSIDCTGPVAMSGQAQLGIGVWHYSDDVGSSFSCTSCTTGRSSGTSPHRAGVNVTIFDGSITAPAGYTWKVAGGLDIYASGCTTGGQTTDCHIVSPEWANVGV